MTDFSSNSAYNANKWATKHARSKGQDTGSMQMIASVLTTLRGIRMTMDAFNSAEEEWRAEHRREGALMYDYGSSGIPGGSVGTTPQGV